MTDTIAASRLSRFGLSADGSACLVEFEKPDGEVGRLAFPPAQLDEVIGLLLQLKQVYAQRMEQNETRSVLVADRVGVLVQADAAVMDFMVGGAPISFAVPLEMAQQLMEILRDRIPPASPEGESR
ncbi:MAG TPA: hypothetical protein VHT51_01865 [Micropepsaceae bacterium]|jgi:hypothetical protein|nr:hypothetical protein [Micropepsaceae bacterium]